MAEDHVEHMTVWLVGWDYPPGFDVQAIYATKEAADAHVAAQREKDSATTIEAVEATVAESYTP